MGWSAGTRAACVIATALLLVMASSLLIETATAAGGAQEAGQLAGTIAFSTVGRAEYAFDVFAVPLHLDAKDDAPLRETQLTDGLSVNHDAQFYEGYEFGAGRLGDMVAAEAEGGRGRAAAVSKGDILTYVSERQGTPQVHITVFLRVQEGSGEQQQEASSASDTEALLEDLTIRQVVTATRHEAEQQQQRTTLLHLPLSALTAKQQQEHPTAAHDDDVRSGLVVDQAKIAMSDRPVIAGDKVYYISTREQAEALLQSWAALYFTSLATGETRRLTPPGVADFSPAVSPSGALVAVASKQGKRDGPERETSAMDLDLYVMDAADGSGRRRVAVGAGWPAWKDDRTLFFHRKADDGWWSIFKVSLPADDDEDGAGEVERVTPPGVHAFTPAAPGSGDCDWVAVATRRPSSSSSSTQRRHVEVFDLKTGQFRKVTERIRPGHDHFNPFVSRATGLLGYHRCRGGGGGVGVGGDDEDSADDRRQHKHSSSPAALVPRLERIESSLPDLALLRVDGDFPAISPDGRLIAYIPDLTDTSGLYVMNRDGSGRRKLFTGLVFGTAWDPRRPGRIYTSYGGIFAAPAASVQVMAVTFDLAAWAENADDLGVSHQLLTAAGTGNNAFPAPSPDGAELVFRSGRDGHKNLYITDAAAGETGSPGAPVRRLTHGAWTDTMPAWSPDCAWIAFSSDRDFPDTGNFAIYLVRPDGSDLHRLPVSGLPRSAGRLNHPVFSPDSARLLVTADLAGNSAEPIATAHQFQPYGELFVVGLDGSGLQRLTHNAYEDGTPAWGALPTREADLSGEGSPVECDFYDVTWLNTAGRSTSAVSSNTNICQRKKVA